jgi:AraC-like DNA-binding protein
MEQLAHNENLNPSYFSKLFSKEIGTSVKAYILNLKIETAKNMLRKSDYSISDIGLSLGFSSQSAFTAAFKKLTGETPARFRKYYNYTSSLSES